MEYQKSINSLQSNALSSGRNTSNNSKAWEKCFFITGKQSLRLGTEWSTASESEHYEFLDEHSKFVLVRNNKYTTPY